MGVPRYRRLTRFCSYSHHGYGVSVEMGVPRYRRLTHSVALCWVRFTIFSVEMGVPRYRRLTLAHLSDFVESWITVEMGVPRYRRLTHIPCIIFQYVSYL